MSDNENDLAYCLAYCAVITDVAYIDDNGQIKHMNAHGLAKLLSGWAIAAPRHDNHGQVIGGRYTTGNNVGEWDGSI